MLAIKQRLNCWASSYKRFSSFSRQLANRLARNVSATSILITPHLRPIKPGLETPTAIPPAHALRLAPLLRKGQENAGPCWDDPAFYLCRYD